MVTFYTDKVRWLCLEERIYLKNRLRQYHRSLAIWFPYSADADSFMYCMPHEGETINLYFRNVWEAQALAVSGARGNGQSCQKTGDYNHRYFTNHERKEMYIAPYVRCLPCIKPGVLSPEAAERLREWSRFGDRLVKVKEKTEG